MLGLGIGGVKDEYKRKATFPIESDSSIQNTKGFVFDGTGDLLSVADHDDFSFNTPVNGLADSPFSFSCWVKRDAVSGNEALFSKAGASGQAHFEYRIFFVGAKLFCDIYDLNSAHYSRASSVGNISTTDWQHLTITFDGSMDDPADTHVNGFRAYLNGTLLTLASGAGGTPGDMENLDGVFKVGAMDVVSYEFDGKMMQVMMFKYKLTQSDVNYLYAGGTAARNPTIETTSYGAASYLIAWWPLDDANGHEDHSLNSHDFTKNGGVDLDSSGDTPF
tara:strand:- start:1853 stop:2683 length:831 start_codon:yes stop_codon:yes gene_type:complete